MHWRGSRPTSKTDASRTSGGCLHTYIALLRGINVGGSNKLAMRDLVGILEAAGFEDVQTYVQSGNAVFRSPRKLAANAAADVGRAIEKRRGFTPKVLVLGVRQLEQAIKDSPYPTEIGKALHFYFLESKPRRPDVARLDARKSDTEAWTLNDRVFYLYAPDGIARSRLAGDVERLLGVPATARNWNTVARLARMAGAAL